MPLLRLILQKRQVGYRNVFLRTNKCYNKHHLLKSSSRNCSSEPPRVSIGDVTVTARKSNNLTMVPRGYALNNADQSTLHHLRWLLQKLQLKQDVYLLGPAGPRRRNIAMALCQLLQSEVEYVAISRDTTEADLKQRREIQRGQAIYIDQAVVRAALNGRILILEGLEKAERNVLPVLNSLLEGREMPLSDGRFLMAHTRYDQLKEQYGEEELSSWGLVRVHEAFQVIALGLPVPRYRGNPLDPPLRSRFQARNVPPVTYQEQVDTILEENANTNPGELKHILSWAYTFTTEEWKKLSIPDFPMDNLRHLFTVLNGSPRTEKESLLHRLYPWSNIIQKDSLKPVEESLKTYGLTTAEPKLKRVDEVQRKAGSDVATVTIDRQKFTVACGSGDEATGHSEFIRTPYLDNMLAELVQSHSAHDFCLVGPRGCGKSLLVRDLAKMLGYQIEPVILYQDMTSRDLLQQRSTSETGDTTWLFAPVVTAAIQGKLAVLDGLHRVHHSTLSVLHRLVHDRELQLFEGTRLLRHDRYDSLKEETGASDAELADKGVYRIHPAFRIAALAEPPAQGAQSWLGPEMVSLFLYHMMRPQSEAEVCSILQKKFGKDIKNRLIPVLRLTERLSASSDNSLQSISNSLSLRQLMRIGRTLQSTNSDLYSLVWEACLARFMPPLVSDALKNNMEEAGIFPKTSVESDSSATPSWEATDNSLRIGNTTVAVESSVNQAKIPHTLFFDIDQHVSTLEGLLRDFTAGEHLLLIGNQGVGKNKLTDRLLYLLNRPREYLQLHRDTTIGNLTVQPSVREGRIVYEDSPLVQAVRQGHVLVLDEADKASTHVTCIIKTLLESGEMVLADGRRIVPKGSGAGLIPIHPEFRMIVLANRPGFPFLGNDFFGVMGDMFACHVIDNPTKESEISLLNQYGADVPNEILEPLVAAFSELRSLADSRMLHYPYSTREAVAIVKHLQKYPEDGILEAAKNVFDFDVYNAEVLDVIRSTFLKHGLPFGTKKFTIELARE